MQIALYNLKTQLSRTERGPLMDREIERYEEQFGEDIMQKEGQFLMYIANSSNILDESNGVKIDTNRCYDGGNIEYFHGEYTELSPEQKHHLLEIAVQFGLVPQLEFSLIATGSSSKAMNEENSDEDEEDYDEEEITSTI